MQDLEIGIGRTKVVSGKHDSVFVTNTKHARPGDDRLSNDIS
jgi:hypothetical protein